MIEDRILKAKDFHQDNLIRVGLREEASAAFCASWTEVGYAKNPVDRLTSHQKHRNSNFLMNIVHSIIKTLLNCRYTLHQYVVVPLLRADLASVCEELVSIISSSYIWNAGGGFSHHPSGRSVASAPRMDGNVWDICNDEVHKSVVFRNNVESVIKRINDLEEVVQLKEDVDLKEKEVENMEKSVQETREEHAEAVEGVRAMHRLQRLIIESYTGETATITVSFAPSYLPNHPFQRTRVVFD